MNKMLFEIKTRAGCKPAGSSNRAAKTIIERKQDVKKPYQKK